MSLIIKPIQSDYVLDNLATSTRNGVTVAFSLKPLSQTYISPVVKLRHSVTGVTKDFYANTSGDIGDTINGSGISPQTWLGTNNKAVYLANEANIGGVAANYLTVTYTLPTSFTISCWVYASGSISTASSQIIWMTTSSSTSQTNNLCPYFGNGNLYFTFIGIANFGNTSALSNTWYHITVTYDGTIATGYINGISKGSYTSTIVKGTTITIGNGAPNSTNAFAGYISDFRIYNRVLSLEEIQYLAGISSIASPGVTSMTVYLPLQSSTSDLSGNAVSITTTGSVSYVTGTNILANATVDTLYDQSGNNRNATQTTIGNQPMFIKRSKEYVIALEANASQFMSYGLTGTSSIWHNTNYTVIIKEQRLSSKTQNYFHGTTTTSANQNLFIGYLNNGNFMHGQYFNDYTYTTGVYAGSISSEPIRRWLLSHHTTNNPGKRMYLNGVQVATNSENTSLSSPGQATLGRLSPGSGHYTGDLYNFIGFNISLPVSDPSAITTIDNYLNYSSRIPTIKTTNTTTRGAIVVPSDNIFGGVSPSLINTCMGAFSTRRILQNYTGPIFRIQKDTNNAEADVWVDYNGYTERVVDISIDDGSTSGGTITYDGAYRIHTFTTNGTFVASNAQLCDILIVGGGGGGGTSTLFNPAGGGGGGEVYFKKNSYILQNSYTIIVGQGGSAAVNGSNSSFGIIIAKGGGAGGAGGVIGTSGGSGGGGGRSYIGGQSTKGLGIGYRGGDSAGIAGVSSGGGGGGGATQRGQDAVNGNNGNIGGTGLACDISSVPIVYGSGGGGGKRSGTNGLGGTNAGNSGEPGGNAIAYTGSGGGGGNGDNANSGAYPILGGSGGSGIVIVRTLRHQGVQGRNAISEWLGSSTATVTKWYDQSRSSNHVTNIRGKPRLSYYPNENYLYGGTEDGLRFSSTVLPSNYTLVHTAQYNSSPHINTSNRYVSLEYPPIAATSNIFTVAGQTYGNGIYTISSSSFLNAGPIYYAYRAFDKSSGDTNPWICDVNLYDVNGNYTGTSNTNNYYGEYCQIQCPGTITLVSFTIQNRTSLSVRGLIKFKVFGSTDQNNWTEVYDGDTIPQSTWVNNELRSFILPIAATYSTFRIVCNKVQTSTTQYAVLGEWRLYVGIPSYRRIFDSATAGSNWYSGFASNASGVAYQISSGTNTQDIYSSNLLVSVDSYSGTKIYRTNGIQRSNVGITMPSGIATNNTWAISGSNYGNGIYTASASSSVGSAPYNAFDGNKTATNAYYWDTGTYTSGTGIYTGATSLNGISGEWLRIQLPSNFVVQSYSIWPRNDLQKSTNRSPKEFVILGSSNGTTWTILDDRRNANAAANWTTGTPQTFTIADTNQQLYLNYSIITTVVGNPGEIDRTSVQIQEWELYGYFPYTPPQLSINYGASAEYSDWIVKDVMVFNNALSSANIVSVENALIRRRLGILDQIAPSTKNTAVAAYSLRLLTVSYTGPCVKIRRGTDNAEKDFYASTTGDIGELYMGRGQTLKEWLNGSTGYIRIWYDQTGRGKHAEQTITTSQPTVVLSNTQGNGIYFNNQTLAGPNVFDTTSVTNMHVIYASREIARVNNVLLNFNGTATDPTRFSCHAPYTDGIWYWDPVYNSNNRASSGSTIITSVGTKAIFSAYKSSTDGKNGFRVNSGTRYLSLGTSAATASGGLNLGLITGLNVNHHIYSLIVFSAKLSTTDEVILENTIAPFK